MHHQMIIETLSGGHINLLDPQTHTVTAEDIEVALNRMARWCGHTEQPWSVANHSVTCAIVHRIGGDVDDVGRLACLLHDIGESVTGDIPTPVKRHLRVQLTPGGPYADFEAAVELPVRRALLPVLVPDQQLCAEVQQRLDAGDFAREDLIALHAEAELLRPRCSSLWLRPLPDSRAQEQLSVYRILMRRPLGVGFLEMLQRVTQCAVSRRAYTRAPQPAPQEAP